MKKIKSIHFVGIKGVGMAPLAIIAKEAGIKVNGCDIEEEFITDETLKKKGITFLKGFSKEHIQNQDLVVTTGAHNGFNNIEVKEAKLKGIKVISQGEAVGLFMNGQILNRRFEGISIAGTHGKTTTTGMLATIFQGAGLDPSFIVGTSMVSSLGTCGHFGKGEYFIAEADEYATEPQFNKTSKFLWQQPKIAVFTNIELDHPDMFNSIEDVRSAFLKFANQLPENGILIANGDDGQNQKLLFDYNGCVITYGTSPKNDFVIKNIRISGDHTFFWLDAKRTTLGEFMINVVGEHNAYNATAAVVVSLECGLAMEKIRQAIKKYTGSKRRFEYIGEIQSGAKIYDDYAHHPTEIKKTLLAFRQCFPKLKIVCIFQPHTYSRTKILFEDFLHSFSSADTVLLTNIYSSLREKPDPAMSSQILAEGIGRFHRDVVFLPELSNVIEYIRQKQYSRDTIIITMGAGDIYKVGETVFRI